MKRTRPEDSHPIAPLRHTQPEYRKCAIGRPGELAPSQTAPMLQCAVVKSKSNNSKKRCQETQMQAGISIPVSSAL